MDSIFLVKIGHYPLLHFLLNHLYFGVIEPVDTNIVTEYQAPLLDNAKPCGGISRGPKVHTVTQLHSPAKYERGVIL